MANDGSPQADEVMDDLMEDDEFDWRRIVTTYPIPSLIVAGVVGFLLGRRRGPEVAEALFGFAAAELTRNVNVALGDKVL